MLSNKFVMITSMKQKAIIHVITGDGQGKTTAALGLSLRAIGAAKKVKLIQFMKTDSFSEHKSIAKFKLPIEVETFGIGFYRILGDKHTETEHKLAANKALAAAKHAIASCSYDLIILDEINVAMGFKLIKIDDVINLLQSAKSGDIVLTGRRAPAKIKQIADRVSDIRNVKNHFDSGICARRGIEF